MTVDPSDFIAESPEETVIDPVDLDAEDIKVADDDTD